MADAGRAGANAWRSTALRKAENASGTYCGSKGSQLLRHIVHRHRGPSQSLRAGAHKAPRAGQLQCGVLHIDRQQPSVVPLRQRDGLL